ncbi:Protein fat-free [Gossypium arboreum]|uniref:Protein fat-free n=1 Tax=Gossypium arboreum TaxID=29729 RepID=A0A0B0NJU5_GOSAR|nr:Protein fat-free [Gossypium arboreum]
MAGLWHRYDVIMCLRIRPYMRYGISMICDPCKTMAGLWLWCVICDYVQVHVLLWQCDNEALNSIIVP